MVKIYAYYAGNMLNAFTTYYAHNYAGIIGSSLITTQWYTMWYTNNLIKTHSMLWSTYVAFSTQCIKYKLSNFSTTDSHHGQGCVEEGFLETPLIFGHTIYLLQLENFVKTYQSIRTEIIA